MQFDTSTSLSKFFKLSMINGIEKHQKSCREEIQINELNIASWYAYFALIVLYAHTGKTQRVY